MEGIFTRTGKAFYGTKNLADRDLAEEFTIELEGGPGEVTFVWKDLGVGAPAVRLEMFDDAWVHFRSPHFRLMMAELTRLEEKTPDAVESRLLKLGLKDVTETEA